MTNIIKPNQKYGYDKPMTLCLRGLTGIGNIKFDTPCNVDLKGVKISTDDKGAPIIESWEDVVFLKDDGSIDYEYMELAAKYNQNKENMCDFTDTKKELYTIYFPEEE